MWHVITHEDINYKKWEYSYFKTYNYRTGGNPSLSTLLGYIFSKSETFIFLPQLKHVTFVSPLPKSPNNTPPTILVSRVPTIALPVENPFSPTDNCWLPQCGHLIIGSSIFLYFCSKDTPLLTLIVVICSML